MTATSIGITASVFGEFGYLRTPDEGQIVIGAAVLDDILGIVILAARSWCPADAAGGTLEIAPIVQPHGRGSSAVRGGRPGSKPKSQLQQSAFDWVDDQLKASHGDKLIGSYFADLRCRKLFLNSPTILGDSHWSCRRPWVFAFAAGLIASTSKHRHEIQAAVTPDRRLVACRFQSRSTVFFVLVGAGMDLSVINPGDLCDDPQPGRPFYCWLPVPRRHRRQGPRCGVGPSSARKTNKLVVGLGCLCCA